MKKPYIVMVTVRNPQVLAYFGWKDPMPPYVRAELDVWLRWRREKIAQHNRSTL